MQASSLIIAGGIWIARNAKFVDNKDILLFHCAIRSWNILCYYKQLKAPKSQLLVTEEIIAVATKLPREGTHWHKPLFLPWLSRDFALKLNYQHVAGTKGFHREWVKPKYLNPLAVIICLINWKGNFTVFKAFNFLLLAHFVNQQFLNFPFYFLKILEKMSNQVSKNTVNPMGILYHHSLIKILIVHQLKERNQTWENFVFKVLS